jgi:D-glycero-D-manno-heptose 1,7-bisphosphate phosphatase
MRRAVLLDRDGVINKAILRGDKPFSPRTFEEFKLLGGVKETLEKFKEARFINIIITNQPDIARGLMDQTTLDKMHKFTRDNLPVDDILVCPHDDVDNCQCRKPKVGMLLEAAKKWNIDLKSSFLIGDRWKDIVAGKKAGCVTILVGYSCSKEIEPDFRVDNLQLAAKIILDSGKRGNSCG